MPSIFIAIESFELECVYINFYDHSTYGYNCKVDYHVETSEPNQTITSVTGRHKLQQLTNDDVDRLFYFDNAKMHYIPVGYTKHFPNLNNLWIALAPALERIYQSDFEPQSDLRIVGMRSTALTEIPADVFANLKNLEEVYLYSNKLRIIDENAFRTCIKLIKVDLHDNQLQYLPAIFADNPKMEDIDLRNNRLAVIDSTLLSGLASLKKVDMRANLCVDTTFPSTIILLNSLNEKIKSNCINPFENVMSEMKESQKNLTEKIAKFEKVFIEKSKATELAQLEKAKLEIQMETLSSNFTVQTEMLKVERDGLAKELKIVSMNHSDVIVQLDNLISENDKLKLNITLVNVQAQKDSQKSRELSEKIEKSDKELKEVKENLTKLKEENLKVKATLVHIEEVHNRTLIDKNVLEEEFEAIQGNFTSKEHSMSNDMSELETSKTTFKVLTIVLCLVFVLLVGKIVTDYLVNRNRQHMCRNESEYDMPYANCG